MDVFSAVSDPTRRKMLDMLRKQPLTAGEIAAQFTNISQPGISKHLKVLRNAMLVKVTIRKQQRLYSLNVSGFQDLEHWISGYRAFWSENLEGLEKFLEKDREKGQVK